MRKVHIGILVICLLFINNINSEEISKNEKETEKNIIEDQTKKTENAIEQEDSNVAKEQTNKLEEVNEDKKVEITDTDLEKKEEKPVKTEEEQNNTDINTPIVKNVEEIPVVDIPKEKIQKVEEKIQKVEEKIDEVEVTQSEQDIKKEKVEEKVKEEEEIVAPIVTTNNVENNTNKQDVEIFEEDEIEKNNTSWKTLIMFIISVIFISGLLILVFLSIYYRIYMFRKRTAPFEVPRILSALFPKPINYEHEITILCSKYMNN